MYILYVNVCLSGIFPTSPKDFAILAYRPLVTQEVYTSFNGATGGHIHCHCSDLGVAELHQRLDLASRRRAFRSTHIQTECSALLDTRLTDEAHFFLLGAIHVDDNDLLGRFGRRVATFHHLPERHRLICRDEGVKNVSAPSSAVLYQQLLGWMLAFHEAVEDTHAIGEGRAADLNDAGVKAKQHSPFKDGEADIVRDDDATAALEHFLDRLLQQWRLCKTSDQEQELDIVDFWLFEELS